MSDMFGSFAAAWLSPQISAPWQPFSPRFPSAIGRRRATS